MYSREQLARSVVEGRLSLNEAAAEFKLSVHSAAKWVKRFRAAGGAALWDRVRIARRGSPLRSWSNASKGLRRERWTEVRIAQATGLSRATVSRILRRLKLKKLN